MFKYLARWSGCGIAIIAGYLFLAQCVSVTHGAPAAAGQTRQLSYVGPAGLYTYNVYMPANYQADRPVPLIVVLAGCTLDASTMAADTGMNRVADQKQFLVAYLQQNILNNSAFCWNFFLATNQHRGGGEAAEIAGITQAVENNPLWTVDRHHVFITGISAGGAMAVNMGVTYPDLYAAIGVHSGVEYRAITTFSLNTTATGGPPPLLQGDLASHEMGPFARVVPTIDFQGSADPIVWPLNGDQVIEQWMETDHNASGGTYNARFASPSTTTHGQVPGGHSYMTSTWNNTSGQEIEEYWVVNGMEHAWSGGTGLWGDPEGPDANLAMYTFFMHFST